MLYTNNSGIDARLFKNLVHLTIGNEHYEKCLVEYIKN